MRLLALNEALNETIQREDYEQAALLRDQIKAITDTQQSGSEKKENEKSDKEKSNGG
jgi:protein arginine kinase activator